MHIKFKSLDTVWMSRKSPAASIPFVFLIYKHRCLRLTAKNAINNK